jgi:hypothetical protein
MRAFIIVVKLILLASLLAGCAARKPTIQIPGCRYAVPGPWADGCDEHRSYQRVFDDRVEFHCVKDVYYNGKVVAQEQVLTYRCVHVKIGGK